MKPSSFRMRGGAHLPQGLGLDLADTFAGGLELAAHILKRDGGGIS